MFVEKDRVQVEGYCLTAHVACLKGTVLAVGAEGDTVRHAEYISGSDAAADSHIAFVCTAQLIDLFLPVRIGEVLVSFGIAVAEGIVRIAALALVIDDSLPELL